MPLKVKRGDKAPDFTAKDQNGQTHSLSESRGKNLVLYFYAKDDTPGCTTEACAFRDNISSLRSHNSEVFGVSVDDVDSHKRFADKFDLTFPLLADPEKKIIEAYGVPVVKGTAARTTILIDDRGIVQRVWENVDPNEHIGEIQNELQAATKPA